MSCGIDYEKAAHDRFWWLNKTGGTAHDNMTVLDYFAAKALQGMLAENGGGALDNRELAVVAYAVATDMMNERTKQESNK